MFLLLDLTDFGTIDRLVESAGPVDILINNAEASQIGPVKEAPA
jgi:NAD(P)-dependent dehydrogenase (short-subunit alcohol dehydrogenase family)